ncbi:hypothetical protein ACRRTK_019284 [Alexandromys fortis]
MGKGYAQAMKGFRVQVIITKISSTESFHEGLLGDRTSKDGSIFVTTTDCVDIILGWHLKPMKNDTIVCNIGHFKVEIDVK